MADQTEAEVVADLTRKELAIVHVEPGKHYVYRDKDGSVETLDLRGDLPTFKGGTVVVRDVASFIAYYERHADPDSEVFCDLDAGTVTAVLDAHKAGDDEFAARWQKHRVRLELTKTQPWLTWVEKDRTYLPQREFAEFLEDNRLDLDPEGSVKHADFLEIAQNFHATQTAEFGEGVRLDNGDTQFIFKVDTQAQAGKTKKFEVPTEFTLAIKPYDDAPTEIIRARFRWRANEGGVKFSYVLDDPKRHAQQAVKDIVAKLADELSKTIMRGTPAA